MRKIRVFGLFLTAVCAAVSLYLSSGVKVVNIQDLYDLVLANYYGDTGAHNSVAAIYLNYRVFDTIFEALMLLVSVMGVIHFSRYDHELIPKTAAEYESHSVVNNAKNSIAMVVPMIIMLSAYLIINGHNTPGGGFQGGAALSSAFICVYLVRPDRMINFYFYEKVEKILFLFIALFALSFAVSNLYIEYASYNLIYLIIMNLLIGLKVFCGLSIIFYRFVHYEDA